MLLHLLWKQKFKWDKVLPDDIITEWCSIRDILEKTTEMKFSRRYFSNTVSRDTILHIFADSSTKVYRACAYLVSSTQSTLIMAKNIVAPVKPLTIPKLELCAALHGARLSQHITSAIECKKVYLWRDSQFVLSWISSTKH